MTKDLESDSKPPYPTEILPLKDKYVMKIDHDYLVNPNDGFILQRCVEHELGAEITPEDLGNNLNGFSVNLLGGKFNPEHVKWRALELNEYWDGREVSSEDLNSNYRYDVNFCGIYIKAADIDGKDFIHPRHYTDESKFNEDITAFVDKFASYKKGEPTEMYFIIYVNHRPTNSNYWHSQIEVSKKTIPVSDPILEMKNKWEKKVLRTFRSLLLPYCTKSYPEAIPSLDPSKYVIA